MGEIAFKSVTVTIGVGLDDNNFSYVSIDEVSISVVIGPNLEVKELADENVETDAVIAGGSGVGDDNDDDSEMKLEIERKIVPLASQSELEQLSGGDMLVRSLQAEGVEYVFGYPGGAVLHIYDALFRQEVIKHFLVRHEQAATHMADGYARATGRPGVVLVTSGPGATNANGHVVLCFQNNGKMQ